MSDEMRTESLQPGQGVAGLEGGGVSRLGAAQGKNAGFPYLDLGSGTEAGAAALEEFRRAGMVDESNLAKRERGEIPRIPPDWLPSTLRKRYPEGLPVMMGGGGVDPVEDHFKKVGLDKIQEFIVEQQGRGLLDTVPIKLPDGTTILFGEYKNIAKVVQAGAGSGQSVEELVRHAKKPGVSPEAAAAFLGQFNPEVLAQMTNLPPEIAQLQGLSPEVLHRSGAEEYLQDYYDRTGQLVRRADLAEKYGLPIDKLPPLEKLTDVVIAGPQKEQLFGENQPQARMHHIEAIMASAEVAGLADQSELRRLQHMLAQDPDQPTIETSILYAKELMKAASKGEGFSNIGQFEEAMRPALRREGLRGMEQMRFKLSVEAVIDEETGRTEIFTGFISPAHFLNVIDDPGFASRLLQAGWGETNKVLLNPDDSSSASNNYVSAISDLYNEVFYRYLRNEKGEGLSKEARIMSSNAYHLGFKSRISFQNMAELPSVKSSRSIRDLLIGPFWGMYKGAFDVAFYFGRFSAWSKTAKGRITMPELRKAYLPHIYYGLLYTEGIAVNEDLMKCAYWHDLWTMKWEKLFPGFEAKFNVDQDGKQIRSLEEAKRLVSEGKAEWLAEWDEIANDAVLSGSDPVGEIQKEILKRHTTRLGYAPAWDIMGSMVVAGLRGAGPFAKHNIRESIKWMDDTKKWHRRVAAEYHKQHAEKRLVRMMQKLGGPPMPPNRQPSGVQMTNSEHLDVLDKILVRHSYDYFFKGPVSEVLSFAEMKRVPWTNAERIVFETVDFEPALNKIGQVTSAYPRTEKAGVGGFYRLLGLTSGVDGKWVEHNDGVGYQHMMYENLEDKDLGSQVGYAAAATASADALYKVGVEQVSNEPITKYGIEAKINLDQAIGKNLAGTAENFMKALAYFDQHISLRLLRDIPIIVANSSCEARVGSIRHLIRSQKKVGTTHFTYKYLTVADTGLDAEKIQWLLDRTWQVSGEPSEVLKNIKDNQRKKMSKTYLFNPSRDPVREITYITTSGHSQVAFQFGGRVYGHDAVAGFAEAISDTSRLNKEELALALAGIHAATNRSKVQLTRDEALTIVVLGAARLGEDFLGKK